MDVAVLLQQLRHFQQMAAAVSAAPEHPGQQSSTPAGALQERTPGALAASTAPASHPIEVQQLCSPSPARLGAQLDQAEPATPLPPAGAHTEPVQAPPPWEATPGAKALVESQQELLAHLQQVPGDLCHDAMLRHLSHRPPSA